VLLCGWVKRVAADCWGDTQQAGRAQGLLARVHPMEYWQPLCVGRVVLHCVSAGMSCEWGPLWCDLHVHRPTRTNKHVMRAVVGPGNCHARIRCALTKQDQQTCAFS
jgi:hypothetical protein